MEQERAMLLLQCWLDLENFQRFLVDEATQSDWTVAQSDAMVLYDKSATFVFIFSIFLNVHYI